MKRAFSILYVVLVSGALCSSPVFAEEEVVGSVVSMDKGHITIEKSNGDKRRLAWSKRTRFFNDGGPILIKRLMPHTKVRIAFNDGEAGAIFLLEAPK